MDAYKKEVWFTILMSLAFVLTGHIGFLFTMFPVEGFFFGFPVMYIVPILFGWFGVLILTVVSGKIGNRLDEIIEEEDQQNRKKQSGEGAM
ncbi:hypothetical protein BKP35_18470 [Anaerobacillus arseniciselenatis]|uniref:Sodium:pantothenate symporter n=1 Tax=Anaerobacillus arseniciselenatis TaxID=85682 RepID=A0A1S2L7B9_9BACI|nr:hypothetical protein [Anaerobacillus arseniciselenatis]OIJ07667.1 hypothetical protein BKP35_18470 [Anaerobacillus arseniciselenatis]